ncbi:MAG: FHA domain-containing protein [Pseudomonadota bacterium]
MAVAGLSSHQKVMTTAMRAASQRFVESTAATELDVTVTEGLQAGARRKLKLTRMRIGAGQENDLVLIEPGLSDRLAEIVFQRSAFGVLVEVTALGPGLKLNGEAVPTGTTPEAVSLPIDLSARGATVRIDKPGVTRAAQSKAVAAARQVVAKSRYDSVLLGICGALIVLILAAAIWHSRQSGPSIVFNDRLLSIPGATESRDWISELENASLERGLAAELSVARLGEGMIEVAGTVPVTKVGGFENLQIWYDGQADAPTVLWNIRRQAKLQNLPAVAMVTLSDPASVILASGQRVGLDQDLTDGWVIDGLSAAGIDLARGTETVRVTFEELTP